MHPTSNRPRKILLLGASGYVGGGLWESWSARHRLVGTCASRRQADLLPLDLRDETALATLAGGGFDVVVHAAGLVDLQQTEADPRLAEALNVRSVQVLIDALRDTPTRLLYLSSDNVFDGTRGEYDEDVPPSPLTVYGRTKVAAEGLLRGTRHLVVRIPIVYGPSPFSDRFLARFGGAQTRAQTDIVCTPLYLPALAAGLEALWDEQGLLHFAGAQVLSRFELMSGIRDALGLPTEVIPVRNADLPSGHLRPSRLVLRSRRHRLAGPDLATALADWAARHEPHKAAAATSALQR